NQQEMEMGMLAQANGGSKAVKDYGRVLEKDHQKADRQLLDMAREQHLQLQMPPAAENKEVDQLKQIRGDEFDKQFLTMMVEGHTKKIDELQKDLTEVNNPQLKSMIQQMLPALKHHRDEAQKLLSRTGADTAQHR